MYTNVDYLKVLVVMEDFEDDLIGKAVGLFLFLSKRK